MFGFPRLRALVAEHAEERSLREYLLEELYSFVGEGWEQEDDITLLRGRANRRATFRTWQLFEGLYSLLTTACHIRYSPIGAASKAKFALP